MKKIIFSIIFIFSFSLFLTAHADTPTITSFVYPQSLYSGQVADFSWTINGGGHVFQIFCSQGIKLKYATSGQTFPCDTKVSISSAASDGASVIIANVSGNSKVVTAKLIPKDGYGIEFPEQAIEVPIYVSPTTEPVSGFFTNSTTTTTSDKETTFSWSSNFLDGVNFKISCGQNVTATSSTSGSNIVPCGVPAFSSDLPGSGTASFLFKNIGDSSETVDVMLLPAMSPGIYDGTHAPIIKLSVASDAQKTVSLNSFSASRQKIYSGDTVLFSWSYENASGANLKLSCPNSGAYAALTSTPTTTLPCDSYIGESIPGKTGTTSLTFFNPSISDQIFYVSVYPQLKNKTYDGQKLATLKITVQPLSALNTNTTKESTTTKTTQTQAVTTPTGNTSKYVFTRTLDVGSKGDDVKALQSFLAKDKTIYPEGLVTGLFGPATKRAVGRFQVKYGLVKNTWDAAYGFVGTKTRAKLNSVQ